MKLLIQNTQILGFGEDIIETQDSFKTHDAIYPKHVVPDAHIIELEVPQDFSLSTYFFDGQELKRIPPPPPSLEEYKTAVQSLLDSTAQSMNYDDIKSAVTYADEPSVPKFQDEGKRLRAWRSLVWEECYSIMEQVDAKELDAPSVQTLIDLLPKY